MIEPAQSFRLEGLEPDNLLAFLALLGLLRALEEAERSLCAEEWWWPRASWDVDRPPWRPRLHLARQVTQAELLKRVVAGLQKFRTALYFEKPKTSDPESGKRPARRAGVTSDVKRREMPDFMPHEFRKLAEEAGYQEGARRRLDILAAIATDQALVERATTARRDVATDITGQSVATDQALDKRITTATPLCLMTGQGHQFFLDRIASIPFVSSANDPQASPEGEDRFDDIKCALFSAWKRKDPARTFSLRWDPEEAARQALMAGDPTDDRYRPGSESGANKLAVIGLSVLPVVATAWGDVLVPGARIENGGVAFYWPIWRDPASLATIRALLAHPSLADPQALSRFGVVAVMRAEIVLIGRFRNVTKARPLLR